jgi:hypothetical protein
MRTRTSAMRETRVALGGAGVVVVMAALSSVPASAQSQASCGQDYAAKQAAGQTAVQSEAS